MPDQRPVGAAAPARSRRWPSRRRSGADHLAQHLARSTSSAAGAGAPAEIRETSSRLVDQHRQPLAPGARSAPASSPAWPAWPSAGAAASSAQQAAGRDLQRRQRRAQLVRGDGQELVARPDRRLGLVVQAGVLDGEGHPVGQVLGQRQIRGRRTAGPLRRAPKVIAPSELVPRHHAAPPSATSRRRRQQRGDLRAPVRAPARASRRPASPHHQRRGVAAARAGAPPSGHRGAHRPAPQAAPQHVSSLAGSAWAARAPPTASSPSRSNGLDERTSRRTRSTASRPPRPAWSGSPASSAAPRCLRPGTAGGILGPLAVGDVLDDGDEAARLAGGAAQQRDGHVRPRPAPAVAGAGSASRAPVRGRRPARPGSAAQRHHVAGHVPSGSVTSCKRRPRSSSCAVAQDLAEARVHAQPAARRRPAWAMPTAASSKVASYSASLSRSACSPALALGLAQLPPPAADLLRLAVQVDEHRHLGPHDVGVERLDQVVDRADRVASVDEVDVAAVAVRKMIGMCSRRLALRGSGRAVSKPSIRGITTSSRITAKSCLQHAA